MNIHCADPVAWSTLVDYWASDLGAAEQDALELHVMGCAHCTRRSAQVASITEPLRELTPPVITQTDLERLRARGFAVAENTFLPGERREVLFPAQLDFLIHRLSGLDLTAESSVDFCLRHEASGRVIVEVIGVPFEPEAGAVLVACQKHYAAMPSDTVAELRVHNAQGVQTAIYAILHVYASRA